MRIISFLVYNNGKQRDKVDRTAVKVNNAS